MTAKCADNIRESPPAHANASAPTQRWLWQVSEHLEKYLIWNQTPKVCINIPTYTFIILLQITNLNIKQDSEFITSLTSQL